MKNSKSVVGKMKVPGFLSRHNPEKNAYDVQGLFCGKKDMEFGRDADNVFPEGMNVEELKRMHSMNVSLDAMGYDRLFEKFLKNVVSRRTFNFFRHE